MEKEIGSGSYSKVFMAKRRLDGQKVAIKQLIYSYDNLVNTEVLIHKALDDVTYVPKLLDIVKD